MAKAKLVVPTALEAANILIMGQITLIYSNVLFQLASIPISQLWSASGDKIFIVALVLLAPPILLINIVSCWVSTRATFEEFEQYPNSLFVLDTFLLILFFFMNNLISFSVGPSEGAAHVAAVITSNSAAEIIGSERLGQILPPFLYFVSGLVCLLYVAWNKQHAKERCKLVPAFCDGANMVAHNRFLFFAAFLQLTIAIYSAFATGVASEGACLLAWAAIWIWLNTQWLITSPLSVKSPESAATELISSGSQSDMKQEKNEKSE